MNTKRKYGRPAVFAVAMVAGLSTAQACMEEPGRDVSTLPVSIENLKSGGFWSHDGEEGFYRVVITASGVEHVREQLFLQWMKVKSDSQTYEMVKSIGIKELNSQAAGVLEIDTDFGDINAFQINATLSQRGGGLKKFAILANEAGKYQISEN